MLLRLDSILLTPDASRFRGQFQLPSEMVPPDSIDIDLFSGGQTLGPHIGRARSVEEAAGRSDPDGVAEREAPRVVRLEVGGRRVGESIEGPLEMFGAFDALNTVRGTPKSHGCCAITHGVEQECLLPSVSGFS